MTGSEGRRKKQRSKSAVVYTEVTPTSLNSRSDSQQDEEPMYEEVR